MTKINYNKEYEITKIENEILYHTQKEQYHQKQKIKFQSLITKFYEIEKKVNKDFNIKCLQR